jgi:hypothetical protein
LQHFNDFNLDDLGPLGAANAMLGTSSAPENLISFELSQIGNLAGNDNDNDLSRSRSNMGMGRGTGMGGGEAYSHAPAQW